MKKVLLIIVALVMIVSGVAAVSAYEAHVINVQAQVESAIEIKGVGGTAPDYAINWGTAFPQEWLTQCFEIGMSTSFCQQTRVLNIDYSLYAEAKHPDYGVMWGGDFMYVKIFQVDPACEPGNIADGGWDRIDIAATPPTDGYAAGGYPQHGVLADIIGPITTGTLFKNDPDGAPDDMSDWVAVAMDVPAFEGYYNALTDVSTKPSGLSVPTVLIDADSTRHIGTGSKDFGLNLKIQVTDIYDPTP